MEQKDLRALLEQVSSGDMTIDQAMTQLKTAPFQDLGFAKVDHHRALRQGVAEVIYGAGKTPEQMIKIVAAMRERGHSVTYIEIPGRGHGHLQTPEKEMFEEAVIRACGV